METEELFDLVARTRPVVLEILENQGYDTKPYIGQSPADVITMAMGGPMAMGRKARRARKGGRGVDLYDRREPRDPPHALRRAAVELPHQHGSPMRLQ